MKKILLLVLLALGTLGQAQDNIENSKNLDNKQKISHLPLNAQKYILNNYPNDSINKAGYKQVLWNKTYEVHYDLWIIEFDAQGNWNKNYTPDGLATSEHLPEQIKETLLLNYPKQKIIRLEQKQNNLIIYLDNNKNISFKNQL